MSFGTWGFKSPFAHRTVRRVVTDIVVETAAMGVVGTASARPRPAQGNPGIDVTIAGAVRFSSVAAAAGWRGASAPFYTARIAVSVLAACCAIPVITSAAGRTALTRPAA